METMLRSSLAVLLLISAVSAAQFTLEKLGMLACAEEGTMERAELCATRALRHEMAHMKSMARGLGLVVNSVEAQSSYAEAAKTMEGIWKAYGH